MKLNRKWLMVIALVMSLTMATAGTLAYLTDRDTEVNTFTMGNVDIEVDEEYEQDSELYPGVKVEKKAGIENVHNTSDAWVWMTVSVPEALNPYIELGWADNTPTPIKLDGTPVKEGYVSYLVKHPTILEAGDSTPKYLQSVTLAPSVDYQDGEYVAVVNGNEVSIGDLSTVDIIVDGYAMQTTNISSVDAAFNYYYAQWGGLTGGESGTGSEGGEPAVGDDDSVTYLAPDDVVEVNGTDQLLDALNDNKTNILLKDGEYEWTGNAGHGKTLNLYGESKNVVLYITNEAPSGEAADYSFHSSNVTFNGLTISSSKYVPQGNNYPGFAYMQATYNDCVIDQTYVLYVGPQTFNYCTLNVSGDKYNIWTWGGENITFNNCTFNSDGKAILLYNGPTTVLTINDCLFNDNGGLSDLKAAIEIGQDYGNRKYTLTVNNTVVNGYEINDKGISTGTTLWGNKNSMSTEDLNVIVDGVDVY